MTHSKKFISRHNNYFKTDSAAELNRELYDVLVTDIPSWTTPSICAEKNF